MTTQAAVSPAPTALPSNVLILVNPPVSGGVIHYAIEDVVVSLQPGEYQQLDDVRERRIRFHKGDDFGEAEHRLQRGIMFDPKAGGVTFREVAQAWIDSRHDLKPGTHAMYRKALAPAATRRGAMRELGIDATFGGYRSTRLRGSTYRGGCSG